jgi:uncharacterized protein
MLVQFLVENFLSFKDETVFSMRAPPGETRAVTDIPGHDGLRLMRVAAFYGANASGKSNLVKALKSACNLVAMGASPNSRLPARPFRLAPDSQSNPTRFQFDFLVDDILYSYTLILTAKLVTGEVLYRTLPNTPDEELIYAREAPPEGGEHSVEFGPMVLSGDVEQQQFTRFVAKGAPAQQPLLTEFATRNVPGLAPIRDWFQHGLMVVGPSDPYASLVSELFENSSLREFYGHMLSAMGTGVTGVNVLKEQDASLDQLIRDLNETGVALVPKGKNRLLNIFDGSDLTDQGLHFQKSGNGASFLKLFLEHSTRSGATVAFPLTEESDGTQRLLHLLPVLFHRTKGPCTVIDELDRSLHTSLTRRFVEEFRVHGHGLWRAEPAHFHNA